MSFITYDPTNIADYENFVSIQQQKNSQIIRWIVIGGIILTGLYLFLRKSEKDREKLR